MSKKEKKRVADSSNFLAEIVGQEGLQGRRMQAGAILDLIDVLAGRVAVRHASSPVVTLSFDRVDLIHPILHQDLVRLEGQLALVGNSSMIVGVRVFRLDSLSHQYLPIQRSFVTMVAVDGELRPNRDIPALTCETEEEQALNGEARLFKARSRQWQQMQEKSAAPGLLTVENVEDQVNKEKRELLDPAESEVKLRRVFLPRHTNLHGTIFGGDILLWMDRVATFTARQFTRNKQMVTIAMNRIFFKQPIYTTDLVEMKANVVYVRHCTLEVKIEVSIQRISGEELESHSGYFIVLNYDEAGFKRPITHGLKLSGEEQESLRSYQQAKERYYFWKELRQDNS